MSTFRWIPRKKKASASVTIHSNVLKVLQTKAPLPSMPRMEERFAPLMAPNATPNEVCYLFGSYVARVRAKANPNAKGVQNPNSAAFRIIELACSLGAYRLALRGELLTDESVFAEARKVMPELRAQVDDAEAGHAPHEA
ncbi:hypothetical protein GETHLI_05590 [Geothrix limicola]|uniref:Uncharacterized protein n=1 Tax=Geothrix limicola TaxID=2927978 RepID=A0ABQ5QBH9_9BACT|nr:hypothetical protein [Geothrix limicola]GLH72057.1 hypothetical protein GETHLI_05590 [Geothrix limicola]